MKVIFNPTDFSERAWKATVIAHKIAGLSQGKLVLMHAYHMPSAEAGFNYDPESSVKVKKEIEGKMDDLISKLVETNPSAEVNFEKVVQYGYATDEIVAASYKAKADLIVMNTGGAHGVVGKVIGSVTGKVIEKSTPPVLAIPKEYSNKDFEKIVFASTLKDEPEKLINTVIDFARLFNAHLTFLNVVEKETDEESKEAIRFTVKNHIGQKGYDNISIEFTENKSVIEGITKYAKQHNADCLVMARKDRTFWENLFNKSRTKIMSFDSRIPLLALHKRST